MEGTGMVLRILKILPLTSCTVRILISGQIGSLEMGNVIWCTHDIESYVLSVKVEVCPSFRKRLEL